MTGTVRAVAAWVALAAVVGVPVGLAAASPLLQWRDSIYVAAGFAGVLALVLLLVQPLLAGGYLPGLGARLARRLHSGVGAVLVAAVVVHVAALWLTSPPDVIDALLFDSPTAFSGWGVTAMWATFAAALLAALRGRVRLRLLVWRLCHVAMAAVVVIGSVVHAVLIDGTMEFFSKLALCALVVVATVRLVGALRPLAGLRALAGRQGRRTGMRRP